MVQTADFRTRFELHELQHLANLQKAPTPLDVMASEYLHSHWCHEVHTKHPIYTTTYNEWCFYMYEGSEYIFAMYPGSYEGDIGVFSESQRALAYTFARERWNLFND